MKTKIITVAILGLFFYSCTPKVVAPVSTPKPANIPMTAELAEGMSLYENNCAKCHKLYNTSDYTADQWKPILVRMQKKAHLDDEQIASISDYINSQL